ncbi:alpha-ketoglutarate-dependent dioxygenase [Pseudoscourfieldia marina]
MSHFVKCPFCSSEVHYLLIQSHVNACLDLNDSIAAPSDEPPAKLRRLMAPPAGIPGDEKSHPQEAPSAGMHQHPQRLCSLVPASSSEQRTSRDNLSGGGLNGMEWVGTTTVTKEAEASIAPVSSSRQRGDESSSNKLVSVGTRLCDVAVCRRFLQRNAQCDSRALLLECRQRLTWNVPTTNIGGKAGTYHREMCAVATQQLLATSKDTAKGVHDARDASGSTTPAMYDHVPLLDSVRHEVENLLDNKWEFNYCLLNRYRDGRDFVGPHSDHEDNIVKGSPIVTVSLGCTRDFVLESRDDIQAVTKEKLTLMMRDGDLLVMPTGCQQVYKHGVPARRNLLGERISLTFRVVKALM